MLISISRYRVLVCKGTYILTIILLFDFLWLGFPDLEQPLKLGEIHSFDDILVIQVLQEYFAIRYV